MATTGYIGGGAAIGMGEEAAWGTAVARAYWLRCLPGANLRAVQGKVPRNPMQMGASALVSRSHYTTHQHVTGGFSTILGYQNCGPWLKHIFGDAGGAGAGGGPYTHTLTLGRLPSDSVKPGMTLELIRGNGTNSEVFEGCLANQVTFACATGGLMTMSFDDIIGETVSARAAKGSPTFGDDSPVLHSDAGTLAWSGNTWTLGSWACKINWGLTRRQQLGSNLTLKPETANPLQVQWDITMLVDDAAYSEMLVDAEDDATITWTSGTNSMAWTLQNAFIEGDVNDALDGPGPIMSRLTLKGQSDGTDDGLKLVLTNDQSAVEDNG